MAKRTRWTWLLSAVALVAGFALLTAAYGVGATKKTPQSPSKSQGFGNFRAVLDTIDSGDPAIAYTGQAWWAFYDVYQTLLTYKHVEGAAGYKLVPGLATSLPKITRSGKLYTFKLRAGLKYSNGKAVKASDFKRALKRDVIVNSPGIGFYENIVGFKRFEKTQKGDISGIKSNDKKRTVAFALTAPRGDFLTILALIFATPVPAGTANEEQAGTVPSTGPYRLANFDIHRGFDMLRNSHFKATRYIPRGNPDRVSVTLVGDARAAVQRVINGQADYTNAAIPPEDISRDSKRGKLKLRPAANTYYFWMNTRVFPFNKVKVRQAVNMAINRNALNKVVWGGLGQATQNVLPPTYPSYRKLNLYPRNVAKARSMIKAAGVAGTSVTVWGRQVSDSVQATTLYASYLDAIGFKTKLNFLPRSSYYQTIGNINTKAQTGWARWLEDYPHPLDWFDVLLNGDRITNELNNNFAWYSNRKTNKLIEKLSRAPTLTPSVNKQWANVERLIMKQAPWAPWSNRVFPEFFSKKMGCIAIQRLYGIDWVRLCKK